MSFSYNHVAIAGNLTRDPQLRTTSRNPVCNFSLAINRRWRSADGEQQEETTFVDCECWGRTAELVAQYLSKGSPAFVEGRLRLDSWQDQEGQRTSRLRVVAQQVQFLPDGRRANTGDHDRSDFGSRKPAPEPAEVLIDGEPPF